MPSRRAVIISAPFQRAGDPAIRRFERFRAGRSLDFDSGAFPGQNKQLATERHIRPNPTVGVSHAFKLIWWQRLGTPGASWHRVGPSLASTPGKIDHRRFGWGGRI